MWAIKIDTFLDFPEMLWDKMLLLNNRSLVKARRLMTLFLRSPKIIFFFHKILQFSYGHHHDCYDTIFNNNSGVWKMQVCVFGCGFLPPPAPPTDFQETVWKVKM